MLPIAVSALAATFTTVGASQAPFMTWSSGSAAASSAADIVAGEGFSREQAISRVRALREGASNGQRRALHFMLLDELHTDDLTTMASSNPKVAAALQTISSEIVRGGPTAKDAMVVSRAELHGDGLPSLREQISEELKGCTVTQVVSTLAQTAADGAVSEGIITRDQYPDILRATEAVAPAADADAECQAFIVPLAKAALAEELQFVADANRLAASSSAPSVENVFVFTSEAAPEPAHIASDAAAERAAGEAIVAATGAKARLLQTGGAGGAATTAVIYGNIQMQPEIVAGLVVGGFLLFVVWVGVSCTMGVRTPDVLHSTTLPAGKEY